MRKYYVYILASQKKGTLYTGMTNNLRHRVVQHKEKIIPGFTRTYSVTRLVYFEEFGDVRNVILREKQIKGWVRRKKIALIESVNPEWKEIRP
jgi:putative endonuclease